MNTALPTMRLLLVDDDPAVAKYLRILLRRTTTSFEIDAVATVQDGLRALSRGLHHVCLLDFRLGPEDGLGLLRLARERKVHTPIILLTGDEDAEVEFAALGEGAADYLNKADLNPARLEHVIGRTIARHRADLVMRERERRVAEAEAWSLVMPAEIGLDGRWLKVSPRLATLLGYGEDELLELRITDLLHPDDVSALDQDRQRLLAGHGDVEGERRFRRHDGTVVWMHQSCSLVTAEDAIPLYVLTHLRDISEQKQLEERVRQAEKMEAVGHLAGGVAHDFNNLLTAILGYADLVNAQIADRPEVQADLEEVLKASRSAAALTQQLLAFSRKQRLKFEVLSVNDAITGMSNLLSRVLGEDVALVTRLAAVRAVKADPVQLQQVLMNLAANARDAMPRGGQFTIETSSPPGESVRIAVSDTGIGMTLDVKARIFEPFFTTKSAGKGTGLGLASVYGIVTQTGGTIECETSPGAGTTFVITLPVTRESAEAAATPAVDAGRGTGTVLVVEDQPAVRRLTRRILESRGFTILDTGDPAEALRLAAGTAIDLVLTDVVMPGMSGPELVARIRSRAPAMPVMFMSGFTGHSALDETAGYPFIRKPFTPDALVRTVKQALAHTFVPAA